MQRKKWRKEMSHKGSFMRCSNHEKLNDKSLFYAQLYLFFVTRACFLGDMVEKKVRGVNPHELSK